MTAREAVDVALRLLEDTPEERAVFHPDFLKELRDVLWEARTALTGPTTQQGPTPTSADVEKAYRAMRPTEQ